MIDSGGKAAEVLRLVAPSVVLNPADTSYGEQILKPSLRRR
jgi:hypothetical protein